MSCARLAILALGLLVVMLGVHLASRSHTAHVQNQELMRASARGDAKAVERLLREGANPNATDRKSRHVLNLAVRSGNLATVSLLIKHGAEVDGAGPGLTPLGAAAVGENAEILDMLLRSRANVNQPSQQGTTPLMLAAASGRPNTVARLLKCGAQVDAVSTDGRTALMRAVDKYAQHPSLKVVELLMRAGANPKRADREGRTAVDLARQSGHDTLADAIERSAEDAGDDR